jgi:hypothetical protein
MMHLWQTAIEVGIGVKVPLLSFQMMVCSDRPLLTPPRYLKFEDTFVRLLKGSKNSLCRRENVEENYLI